MANPPPKIRWAIFFALALLALALRLPQLGERSMHTDESVNAIITGGLLAGEGYQYDPRDRHGPVLYLLAWPVAKLLGAGDLAGLTEVKVRFATVLAGSATVLLIGCAVEMLGFIPCLLAALLFAAGPLPVFYSRYFIHETLFVGFTLGMILSGWRMVKEGAVRAAAMLGFCAALMLASKETAVIHFFGMGIAGILVWMCRAQGDVCRVSPKAIGVAVGVFMGVLVLLFTWFGTNWSGLGDLVQAMTHVTARAAGQGHEKAFSYYLGVLDPQFLLSFVALAGVYAVLCDAATGARRAGLFLLAYALVIFLVYSLIPYKTPWLALNLWLPLTLLCGLGVEGVWRQMTTDMGRWVVAVSALALVLVVGQMTKTLAFDRATDERNPLVYAHTSEDILGLAPRIKELCRERKIAHPRIAVVAIDAWPLPWYLRGFSQVGYWQPGQETGPADLFITPPDPASGLAERLKDWRPEFFGVRPNVLLILWIPPPPI